MRFFKDSKKIYLDSAKAGPLYYELLKWRNDYEKKSLIDKSQIRVNHENFVKDVEKSVSEFFKVDSGDVFFTNSFSRGFHSLVSKINGKPLIYYTIKEAKKSKNITKIAPLVNSFGWS